MTLVAYKRSVNLMKKNHWLSFLAADGTSKVDSSVVSEFDSCTSNLIYSVSKAIYFFK